MFQGKIHLYTGNGKGKTTAALGLALRAYGAGLKIFIGQFVKGIPYSEHHALACLNDRITVKQYGRECFIHRDPEEADKSAAEDGFLHIKKVMESEQYDLIILDEICIAIYFNLIKESDVIDLCRNKPKNTELVLTGRYASPALFDAADLVTQMKEIKHYYNTENLEARVGIEK